MPIPGREALAGGGDRPGDIGIITGLRGRRAAGRVAGSGRWRCGRGGPVEGSLFVGHVGVEVDLCRGTLVAEPQSDDGDVDSGVQQAHGGGVPQGVRGDVLAGQRRAGSGGVAAWRARRCSTASRLRGCRRGRWNSGSAGSPARSVSQARRTATVCGGERGDPLFAALAEAGDVRPGAEVDVAAGQAGQLGDAQPGLDGEAEHGVVAAAGPGGAVGRGQQRVGLGVGEVGDQGLVGAFGGDGQDAVDERRRARGGAARRSGTGSGSRPAGRCGSGRCCRGRVRGGRGTRRSPARPGRRCPAGMAACRPWLAAKPSSSRRVSR